MIASGHKPSRLVRALLRLAKPYHKGHLYHSDGSLYMARYGIFETRFLSCRLHHIATEDRDPHLHDHPWSFVSIMLSGSYVEARPAEGNLKTIWLSSTRITPIELHTKRARSAPSIALRRTWDRHKITMVTTVNPVWTLVFYGPIRQWWGFFERSGKTHWRDYLAKYHTRTAKNGSSSAGSPIPHDDGLPDHWL